MRFSSTRLTRNLSAIATLFVVSACDAGRLTNPPENQTPASEAATAASIVLSRDSVDMAVGDLVKLTASAYDRSGAVIRGRDVQWSTSTSRARVSNDGTVEGVQIGTDTVFATMDGQTGKAALRVFVPKVISVVVSLNPTSVEVGQASQASATLYNQRGEEIEANIFWSSNNTNVATVDQAGLVTTLAPGTAKIKAVSEGKTDTENLTVVAPVAGIPATVVVISSTYVAYVGKKTQLATIVKDGNGTVVPNAVVTWSTSNPSIATVSGTGEVTGVAVGNVTITATSGGKSGTAALSVALAPVNALTLALQPATVVLGGSSVSEGPSAVAPALSLAVVTAYDADGAVLSGRPVSYSSSNTSVATVNTDGVVSGFAPGTAMISATSEGKTASAAFTVNAAPAVPVASVSVVLSSPTLQVGASTQALATPLDAGGQSLTGRSVTWSSSNTAVATVNSAGLVTAVAAGTSSIRATSEGKTGSAQVTVVQAAVLTSIEISPASATLNVGESRTYSALGRNSDGSTVSVNVTWSATGGNITQQGGYTAGQIAGQFLVIAACACGASDTSALNILAPTPPPAITAISVAPTSVTLVAGDSVQVSASAWLAGSNFPVAASVVWSATGGTVTQTGKYKAGSTTGTFYVRATSTVDATKKDSTMVSITAAPAAPPPSGDPIAALTVSPETMSLQAGQAYTFVANGWLSGASTPIVTPVIWTATGGTVDQTGRYVAGSVAGTYVVRARSTEITWRVDSAIVTIAASAAPPPPTPTVTSFSLTPATVSLLTLATVQLQTSTVWSDGATRSVNVSYSATGGSVSQGGLYTAGLLAGAYRVIATCDCGRADTTAVNIMLPIAPPPPTGSGIPIVSDDFGRYTSTTDLIANPYGTFGTIHDVNPQHIVLDPTGGVDGGKAMRFDFPDRTGETQLHPTVGVPARCTDWGISRKVMTPNSPKKVWIELYAKFSMNWKVAAPSSWGCTSNPDYKFVFGGVEGNAMGQYGRFQLDTHADAWILAYPGCNCEMSAIPGPAPSGYYGTSAKMPYQIWDGQYHQYRFEFKMSASSTSTDGGMRVWVDGVLLVDVQNLVIDRPSFWSVILGANINQGPGQAQSLWWDSIRVWDSNPGW